MVESHPPEERFEIVKEEAEPPYPTHGSASATGPALDSSSTPQASPDPTQPGMQLSEAVMALVMFGLVAWTCYLLYGPQIVRMTQLMLGGGQ